MSKEVEMIKARKHKRAKHDWYQEPEWCVQGLLDLQVFTGLTLDPACGGGVIPNTFIKNGLRCVGSDIVDRGWGNSGWDFTKDDYDPPGGERPDNVVSNPPFKHIDLFLKQALRIVRHKVAFLLRLPYLESSGRRWVFEDTPICAIHPFAHRVSIPPAGENIDAEGGKVAYAWFVFDHSWLIGAPPIVRRIERHPNDT